MNAQSSPASVVDLPNPSGTLSKTIPSSTVREVLLEKEAPAAANCVSYSMVYISFHNLGSFLVTVVLISSSLGSLYTQQGARFRSLVPPNISRN